MTKTIPSAFIPKRAPQVGYSCPTSTITSQAYEREKEQERKPKIEYLPPNVSYIKKEPSLLDDVVYEGSMMRNGMYVNHHKNINRPNPAFPTFAQYQNIPQVNEQARIPSRPSVIRNTNTERGQEQKFLQMEAKMLKMHGDILKQTGKSSILNIIIVSLMSHFSGNLMNFPANILGQLIMQAMLFLM